MVVALLKHLQEAHNETRCREHQHLEVDIDGRPGPNLAVGRARELREAREGHLGSTLYAGNPVKSGVTTSGGDVAKKRFSLLPHYDILRRDILRFATRDLTINTGGIEGRRDPNNNVGGGQFAVKICLDREDVRDLCCANFVHCRNDA